MRNSLLAAAAVLALVAPRADAQSEPTSHRGVISAQLDHATKAQGAEGYRVDQTIDPQTVVGLLPKQSAVVLEITLRAGVQYFISGVCDTDCEDLDLRLHAPDQKAPVAEDVEDDDVPLLLFTASQSGPHMLMVRMSSCKTDLCYFGFRVLAKK